MSSIGVQIAVNIRLGRGLRCDLTDLRVDQFRGDILGGQFAVLGHFGEGLGQVHEGFLAVGSGEEEQGQGFWSGIGRGIVG